MAKIAVHDNCNKKFMKELMEHWQTLGHEVKMEPGFNPVLVNWADIIFFDWVDANLIEASNPANRFWTERGIAQPKGKHIVARCHDIDAWVGHYHSVNWEWVDDLIFVAHHIKDLVLESLKPPTNLSIHLIRHGVNPDKWTFRKKEQGKKIAWVGNIRHPKEPELALQVLAENPDYELHMVGRSLDSWELAYFNDFVQRNNLKFFYTPEVADLNTWLEDKDFCLLTSIKEAFSYITAETMLKGIKPIVHHFYGAENVWPAEYLWDKVSDVRPMLEGSYKPEEYRDFINKNYNFQEFLEAYDKILFKYFK